MLNFPFFMLLIGPSQTGKTCWIYKFLKYFSYINPGHTLNKALYLHMTYNENIPFDLEKDLLKKNRIS